MADSRTLAIKIEAIDATRKGFNDFRNTLQKAKSSLKEMKEHLKDVGKAGADFLHREKFVSLTAQVGETGTALSKLATISDRLSTATKVSQKDNIQYKQVLKEARKEVAELEKSYSILQKTLEEDVDLEAETYAKSLGLVQKKLDTAKASLVEYGKGTLSANKGLTTSVRLNKELGTATKKLTGENSKLLASQKQVTAGLNTWATQAIAKSKTGMKKLKEGIAAEAVAKKKADAAYIKQVKFNSRVLQDIQKKGIEAEAAAKKKADAAYIKQVKFNSRVLENIQKKDIAAVAATKKKADAAYIKQVKFNSRVLESIQKKDIAAVAATKKKADAAYTKQVKFNSRVLESTQKEESRRWRARIKFNSKILEDKWKKEEKALRQKKKIIKAEKTFAQRVKTSAKNLGAYLVVYKLGTRVLQALGRAFADTVKKSMDLEKALVRASTIAGPFKSRMGSVENSVKGMSAAFGTDVVDNVDAFYKVLSAGFKDNPLEVLAAAQKASVGGFVEIGDSVKALTAVMNIFNKSAKDADDINNVLFKAVDQGVFVYGDMASGIATAGQSAKNAGIKFKELMGILAASSKTTQSMAKSATQVRQAAISMVKPTAGMVMVLDRLGAATGQDLVAQMGSGIGAFQAIREATDELGLSLARVMGRKEAYNAILSLTEENLERTVGVIEKVRNEQDLLSEATKMATGTLDSNLKKWGQLASQLAQSAINPWLDRFNKFIGITEERAKSLSEKITFLGHAFTILAQPGPMTAKLTLMVAILKNQDKILAKVKLESTKKAEIGASKIKTKAAKMLAESLAEFEKTQAARRKKELDTEVAKHQVIRKNATTANHSRARREREKANKEHKVGLLTKFELDKKLGEIGIAEKKRQLNIEQDFFKKGIEAEHAIVMRFKKERLSFTNKTSKEKDVELKSFEFKNAKELAAKLLKLKEITLNKIHKLAIDNIRRKPEKAKKEKLINFATVERMAQSFRLKLGRVGKLAGDKYKEGFVQQVKKLGPKLEQALKDARLRLITAKLAPDAVPRLKEEIFELATTLMLLQRDFKKGLDETVEKARLLREQLEEIISIWGGMTNILQNMNTLWGALGNKTSKWLTGLMHVAQIMQKIYEIKVAMNKQKMGAALGSIGGIIGAAAGIAGLFMHEGGPIQKLHNGGMPNTLASNEVPIIAERGEFMFSKRAVDNLGGQGNVARMHQNAVSGGQQAGSNVELNVSFDPDNFRNFLTRTEEGKSIIHNAVIEAFPS